MKMSLVLLLLVATNANRVKENPLAKTIDLLQGLASNITADGEREEAAFHQYFEWCDEFSANTKYEVDTASARKEKLEAKIEELAAAISAHTGNIDDLTAAIATSEADLAAATNVRAKEAADFAAGEAELVEGIDTLTRAKGVISREMAKNPAAFTQLDSSNMQNVLSALTSVFDAASFSSSDQKKLAAFVQARQSSESDDTDLDINAPAAAVYKTHSGGILDTLEDLKEKAETDLSDLRKAEANTKHNFEMLKQSLTDQANADTKDLNQEKADKAAAEEAKAAAEGNLNQTEKDLADAQARLAHAQKSCVETAANHDATIAARQEELKVINDAIAVLKEKTGGAEAQTYSFIQTTMKSRADLANSEVLAMIKKLANDNHSAALAQLASRISAIVHYGAAGEDPFKKVKELISGLITKLEAEADDAAKEKAYCDEQMERTELKKSELEASIAKLSSKIDQATAKSADLKMQVKESQAELATLAKEQAEMDALRKQQNADYQQAKADLELGLSGVRQALGLLRDYYGSAAFVQQPEPPKPELHKAAQGSGDSIIGILEVVESDFAANLVKEETQETQSQAAYDKQTQENEVTRTLKEQDVKYNSEAAARLDKAVGEMTGDRSTQSTELEAVDEFYGRLKERCIAKPETYEVRKARRAAEIEGLKQALSILENEAAFVQRKRHGFLGSLTA